MASKTSNSAGLNLTAKIATPKPVKIAAGCIYGDIGSGKTHLLCTATEHFDPKKVLIITLDREDETLSKFADRGIQVLDLIKASNVKNGAVDIHTTAKELLKTLRTSGNWQFVGFDSVTKLSVLQRMQSIADRNGGDMPEQRDYGIAQNRVIDFMWNLRNTAIQKGFHLFITAWEKDEWIDTPESTEDGYSRWYPDLPPEMGRLLRHDWSFLGRMQSTRSNVKASSRGATVQALSQYSTELTFNSRTSMGKDRVGFPGSVKNPTIKLLLDGRYGTEEDKEKTED